MGLGSEYNNNQMVRVNDGRAKRVVIQTIVSMGATNALGGGDTWGGGRYLGGCGLAGLGGQVKQVNSIAGEDRCERGV